MILSLSATENLQIRRFCSLFVLIFSNFLQSSLVRIEEFENEICRLRDESSKIAEANRLASHALLVLI